MKKGNKKSTPDRGYSRNPKTSQIFNMWRNMMRRCHYSKYPSYKYYGGRGIKVIAKWHNFEQFLSDEYEYYDAHRQLVGSHRKDLTIDRIDNNGNYEPENIRYVSAKVQNNNRRNPDRSKNGYLITFKGKTLNIKDWSRELNINYSTLIKRFQTYKWSVEKALTTPVKNI